MNSPTCNTPLAPDDKGLDGIHCQMCWERLCSQGWWEMIEGGTKDISAIEIDKQLRMAEYERLRQKEIKRERALLRMSFKNMTPEERFHRDSVFRQLVSAIEMLMDQEEMSEVEFMQALSLAKRIAVERKLSKESNHEH